MAEYCSQHAPGGMVDVLGRKYRTEGCNKQPSFGVAGKKKAEYCARHEPDAMVNVRNRTCTTEGCNKIPSFGVAGTKTAEYCALHGPDGMVNVRSRKCRTEGCSKQASFGVAGRKTAKYCIHHARDGMVNTKMKVCTTEGSGMNLAFRVAGSITAEHRVKHNRPRCGVEGCRGRGIDPNQSGKGTSDDASPGSSMHEAVQSSLAQASPLSGGSRGSRKRVRYLHVVPTALTRAVALESAATGVTIPEIERQNLPSSEVLLLL